MEIIYSKTGVVYLPAKVSSNPDQTYILNINILTLNVILNNTVKLKL